MRKHLLPSLLILALTGGLAVAQTITRAIQLSQDTTGAFSVDTNNGIYFPSHILGRGNSPSIAGTGTPTIRGTDFTGEITMGTSGQTAIATFAVPYLTNPWCVATTNVTLASPLAVSALTNIMTITQPATTGNKIAYFCSSSS